MSQLILLGEALRFDLLWLNLCTKPHKVRRKEITILISCSVKAVLPNLPDNSQIHAHNFKGPAERDLPYIACSKDNLVGD